MPSGEDRIIGVLLHKLQLLHDFAWDFLRRMVPSGNQTWLAGILTIINDCPIEISFYIIYIRDVLGRLVTSFWLQFSTYALDFPAPMFEADRYYYHVHGKNEAINIGTWSTIYCSNNM
jgi:hypothetical protein